MTFTFSGNDPTNARWAHETLELFQVDSLLLLALVTEFVQAVEAFMHAFDQKGAGLDSSCPTCRGAEDEIERPFPLWTR